MNRTKYILRVLLLLLTVYLLVDLNRKTNDNMESIAEFKFKTIEKLRTDSLDAKHKLDLLVNETTKFVDHSAHVREGIRYLMGLLVLWAFVEMGFMILEKRNSGREIK